MKGFSDKAEYLRVLEERCRMPLGFCTATYGFPFVPSERPEGGSKEMTLSLIRLDEPTDRFAGVFTRNRFPGAPVILGKSRLSLSSIRGVMINNKVANVCADKGVETARGLCDSVGAVLGDPGEAYFSSSTGVIGWELPRKAMEEAVGPLVKRLEQNRGPAADGSGAPLLEVAQGIMTTDSFAKVRSAEIGAGRIVAVAKGAGMIEPNMATMLCFILTDIDIDRDALRRILPVVVDRSFNRISVDGDQSTSDMVLAFSSGRIDGVSEEAFAAALQTVLGELAEDIVRNGEGTGHVIRVDLSGAPDDGIAREAAKAIVNSPLVKTAVAGNDPNVGRILSSLGDFAGNNGLPLEPGRVSLWMGEHRIFHNGRFELDQSTEDALSDYLVDASIPREASGFPPHFKCVDIRVELGLGDGSARVLGSDLTHDYVTENADYRT